MTTLRQAAQAVIERWDKTRYVMQDEMTEVRTALAAPEQKPYGWMVQGVPTVMRGALAREIKEQEAKQIGGTCSAFPLYAAPADIEAITKERDALMEDAARYQWVKKQTRAFSLDMGGQHSWTTTGGFGRAKGPSLDEAIDAAIKAGVQ